jgi:hypothetical protein
LHRPGRADRSLHLALNAPNALFQEVVRAYCTGWYKNQ